MAAHRVKKPVYVDTNLDTRVVVTVSAHCSTRRFRKKFLRAHLACYPAFGKLKVHCLQVKHKSEFTGFEYFYNLSETIPIEDALGGEDRCLHVEASEKKRKKWKDSMDELVCEECGSGDNEEELLICDKCNKGFHLKCLRPVLVRIPIGDWYCSACSLCLSQISKLTTLDWTEVMDFFGIKNFMEPMEKFASGKDSRKRRSLVYSKKKRKLLPYEPTKDESQRRQQMESLAFAMMKLNMSYSPLLTYISGMAPKSANDPKLENGGMQVLTKEDKKTLNYVHDMGKAGVLPPLMVVHDSHQGYISPNDLCYTVEARSLIKEWTLVAEYVGDVDYLRNREEDDCNSLMTLLSAKDTSESLVICPDKRGNIARFISGINNHFPESKKKVNLKCVRYDVDGECRALLVATRDIANGERLYYDYNGLENEYPTHNFV